MLVILWLMLGNMRHVLVNIQHVCAILWLMLVNMWLMLVNMRHVLSICVTCLSICGMCCQFTACVYHVVSHACRCVTCDGQLMACACQFVKCLSICGMQLSLVRHYSRVLFNESFDDLLMFVNNWPIRCYLSPITQSNHSNKWSCIQCIHSLGKPIPLRRFLN